MKISTQSKSNDLDNEALENAKKIMLAEMGKKPTSRDVIKLKEALKVTFMDRKSLIETNILMSDSQKIYLALFSVLGIEQDFYRAQNCNLHETVLKTLHASSSAIMQYARKKKKDHLLKLLDKTDNHINNKLVLSIILIPEILNEKHEFLYRKCPIETELSKLEDDIITPHLCVIGDPFSSSEIYIIAEKRILIECCEFVEAIATLIGFYFVANIEYPAEAAATFKFFHAYVFKFQRIKLPGKLLSFCKALP